MVSQSFKVFNQMLLCSCIILLLECVQSLSKFGQIQDVFICDFVSDVKVCEADLYQTYCDLVT